MNFASLKRLMAIQAELIRQLVADISDDQARWKPEPERWSILEVLGHLYDEEREDFRVHLDLILQRPEGAWSPIRPMEWVNERRYNERELAPALQAFLTERRASLAWLETLKDPDWEASIIAPWNAPIRAGDMLASWVVHDQWHIEQLLRLRRDYTIHLVRPYDTTYAGRL